MNEIIRTPGADEVDVGITRALVRKLRMDLSRASTSMSISEVQMLVDGYYQMQDNRIRSAHQVTQLTKTGEPHLVLAWLMEASAELEQTIKGALDAYSRAEPLGRWARSIYGIGPVIAAGLLAHIDITRAPTVGKIWRFGGYDPTAVWKKGQKRPHCASFKRLNGRIGDCFTKFSGDEQCFYGHLYAARHRLESEANFNGKYTDQCAEKLAQFDIQEPISRGMYEGRYRSEDVRAECAAARNARRLPNLNKCQRLEPGQGTPMLPLGRITLRAQRYATKLFLAAYHHVAYELHYGEPPPKPYAIKKLGHEHEVAIPNWPYGEWREQPDAQSEIDESSA